MDVDDSGADAISEVEVDKSFYRFPAVEKRVSEISGSDKRVSLIGTVKNVDPDNAEARFVDESGECLLLFTDLSPLKQAEEGMLGRVIGKPLRTERGYVIRIEFLQNFSGFDTDIYKKIKSLESIYN